jgi:CheY-like chemotaxis protein
MPVSKSILLVDDDDDDRMLFSEAFKQVNNGFELVELKNGEELLQYLNQHVPPVPQLIVMDFHMELMTGEEALNSIKKNKQLYRIPVIVYSGSSSTFQQDPILRMGANAYVQKPNTYEQMVDVVKSMLLLFAPN